MKFKSKKDKEQYNSLGGEYASESNLLLRQFIDVLEAITVMLGLSELVITSYIRKDNIYSLHYYGRALDIRVWDHPVIWYWAMTLIGMAITLIDSRFRMNPHTELYGKPQQHIHIEIRDK